MHIPMYFLTTSHNYCVIFRWQRRTFAINRNKQNLTAFSMLLLFCFVSPRRKFSINMNSTFLVLKSGCSADYVTQCKHHNYYTVLVIERISTAIIPAPLSYVYFEQTWNVSRLRVHQRIPTKFRRALLLCEVEYAYTWNLYQTESEDTALK